MLSDRCPGLSVCSVCDVNVGVLWPNGWMDQDETWHGGRLGPGHTVLDGNPAPQKGNSPQFSPRVCCGQITGWTKMPLGMDIDLGPDDIALDGDSAAPISKRGRGAQHPAPNFGPCIVAKRLHGSRCHLIQGQASSAQAHCVARGPSSSKRGTAAPNFPPMSVVAKGLDGSRLHLLRR